MLNEAEKYGINFLQLIAVALMFPFGQYMLGVILGTDSFHIVRFLITVVCLALGLSTYILGFIIVKRRMR